MKTCLSNERVFNISQVFAKVERFTNYHGAMILFVSLAWTKERKHGMKELLNAKKEDTMAILNFVTKKIPFSWLN